MTNDIVILLVEDEPLILIGLQSALEDGGYAVLTAASGTEAMALVESRHQDIAGLITDIRLGVGPSGWDVAHRVRQLEPQAAVVYISGDSSSDWLAEGVPKSIMLPKPFAHAQLITAFSSLLNEMDAP